MAPWSKRAGSGHHLTKDHGARLRRHPARGASLDITGTDREERGVRHRSTSLVRRHLSSVVPHLSRGSVLPTMGTAAPFAVPAALLLSAASGASAVTLRKHTTHHAATASAQSTAARTLALPAPVASAAPAPPVSENSAPIPVGGDVATVPRAHRLVEATLLVSTARPMSAKQ